VHERNVSQQNAGRVEDTHILHVEMECGENSMFHLRDDLLRAQEMYIAAKIDGLSKGKTDAAAKNLMLNGKRIQAIKCPENTVELMEMAQRGIVAESKHASEAIMVDVNQPIEKGHRAVGRNQCRDILGNGGEMPGGYVFPNPFAKPERYP